MVFLDEVLHWDEAKILCRTGSHRNSGNPLRAAGRLGAACGVEFAAQAMALHGCLTFPGDQDAPRAGLLASVRELELRVARLDDIEADLEVEAERLAGDALAALYAFALRAEGVLLLRGRASAILNAELFSGNSP
jgi:predicted hotdog family 3-hydroxylacyl-ACP dehydratase